jgi:hypothetical protein
VLDEPPNHEAWVTRVKVAMNRKKEERIVMEKRKAALEGRGHMIQ